MNQDVARIRDNEGVVNTVVSEDLRYPCEPLILDYDFLFDDSAWEDLREPLTGLSNDEIALFRVRADDTDERLFCYLSQLLLRREYSVRGVYIASLAIKRNPANYTAWLYRMECAERLHLTIAAEMEFARKVAYESPKSYQAWQYRRRLCESHGNCVDELSYIKFEISSWPKNHCAWSHLTWLMTHFGESSATVQQELKFVDFLLSSDAYNNTAWVYKSFLLSRYAHLLDPAEVVTGCVQDFQLLLDCPWNESLGNYLEHAVGKLCEARNACAGLPTCDSTCGDDVRHCFCTAIERNGAATGPLLSLQSALEPCKADTDRVRELLRVSDPLRP